MWIIPGGRSSNYLARFGIFLTMAALIVGMVGCVPTQYDLTISSAEGGEVTTPGEGTFSYEKGTVVNLTAEADEGYQFFNWTGNVSAIDDVNAATTTITINDDYTITANFALIIPIWDWYDLDAIRDNLGDSYILMNDLDDTTAGYAELASPTANEGKGWQPIGTDDNWFAGALDGWGYEIRDLFINRPDGKFVALFGTVGEGNIENIGVVNVTVTGDTWVGGLVGHIQDSTVSNSYVTGNVTGEDYKAGGLAGCILDTSVSNSYSTVNVNGHKGVGGLAGEIFYGNVINSYSTGNVTGDYYVGGLVGSLGGYSIVSDSYSTGNVTGNSWVGGLVGDNGGAVSGSYSTGRVSGGQDVGGLVGKNKAFVNDSFWDIETSGQATSAGGTGKNTTEMQNIATFSGTGWDIISVANPDTRNLSYIWNIVNNVTYPFLSWQP